jgi:hypothetical protein
MGRGWQNRSPRRRQEERAEDNKDICRVPSIAKDKACDDLKVLTYSQGSNVDNKYTTNMESTTTPLLLQCHRRRKRPTNGNVQKSSALKIESRLIALDYYIRRNGVAEAPIHSRQIQCKFL